MSRKLKCVFTCVSLIYLVAVVPQIAVGVGGSQPPPAKWSITDPNVNGNEFSANVSGSGPAATPDASFQLKVRIGTVSGQWAQTQVGTSTSNSDWAATCVEPQGGWTSGNSFVGATLELYVGGQMQDSKEIKVK